MSEQLLNKKLLIISSSFPISVSYDFCWNTSNDSKIRYVFCHNRSCTNYGAIAYFYTRHHDNSHSYPNIISNDNFRHSHSLLPHWNICPLDIMCENGHIRPHHHIFTICNGPCTRQFTPSPLPESIKIPPPLKN